MAASEVVNAVADVVAGRGHPFGFTGRTVAHFLVREHAAQIYMRAGEFDMALDLLEPLSTIRNWAADLPYPRAPSSRKSDRSHHCLHARLIAQQLVRDRTAKMRKGLSASFQRSCDHP